MATEDDLFYKTYDFLRVGYNFITEGPFPVVPEEEEEGLTEGARLFAVNSNRTYTVGEYISGGGEGDIYYVAEDRRLVMKIYNREKRDPWREKKVSALVEKGINFPGIIWPKDILRTEGGAFVGYIMPYVSGEQLNQLMAEPKRVIISHRDFCRKVQVDVILEVLSLFKQLHDNDLLFGDVNACNIMVDSAYRVFFVDMDCVQVGQFPCLTTTEGYDAPEIILKRGDDRFEIDEKGKPYFTHFYSDYYRTLETEYFSVAVLIYRFLFRGLAPYSYNDYDIVGVEGEVNDNELCIKGQFAYSVSEERVEATALHRATWSHLPSFLKEAFANSFTGKKRYSVPEWIEIFKKYKELLSNGKLEKVDSDANNPYPAEEIAFSKVAHLDERTVEARGFAMWQAVGRIVRSMGDAVLEKNFERIVNELKQFPVCTVGGYQFKLVYNIGILKKVKCDYVL